MRKLRIALACILFFGILLCGIGTGVMWIEYSSFEYAGKTLLGEDHLETSTYDYRLPEDGAPIILRGEYFTNRYASFIDEDSSVPEGIVRYQVTYNSSLISPNINFVEYDRSGAENGENPENAVLDVPDSNDMEQLAASGEDSGNLNSEDTEKEVTGQKVTKTEPAELDYAGELWLGYYYFGDEFQEILEHKDQMLENLKNKKISLYRIAEVTDVKIMVNPKTRPRILYEIGW